MNNITPIVSINCLVYNHAKTIRNTLDGFLMQKTNFHFEVIVHDDASTDGTTEIIKEYANKYPNIIHPIIEKKNLYAESGFRKIFQIMHEACIGKYIAYCEGDDYWTDPLKLQKQVDYLEAHPEITYSCCRFYVQNEFGTFKEGYNKYFDNEIHKKETEFIFDQSYPFLEDWVTLTLTQVIRRDAINLNFRLQFKYSRDVHLIYDVLTKGKGVCHNFFGGVCIVSEASTFGKLPFKKKILISYNLYNELYNKTRSEISKRCLTNCYISLIKHGIYKLPKHFFELRAFVFNSILKFLTLHKKKL